MDLRNHGDSPHGSGMGYVAQARDVAETLAARHAQGAAVVGHSMGGKTAMALALGHPGLISRLVVADIAPRRYPPALRGYVAAMRGLELRPGLSRREADAALADAVPEAGIRAFLVQSIDFGGDAPRWTLGLAEIAAAWARSRISPWPGSSRRRRWCCRARAATTSRRRPRPVPAPVPRRALRHGGARRPLAARRQPAGLPARAGAIPAMSAAPVTASTPPCWRCSSSRCRCW
jgi:pimeloyl-ACP methyl ester carboxylesterase